MARLEQRTVLLSSNCRVNRVPHCVWAVSCYSGICIQLVGQCICIEHGRDHPRKLTKSHRSQPESRVNDNSERARSRAGSSCRGRISRSRASGRAGATRRWLKRERTPGPVSCPYDSSQQAIHAGKQRGSTVGTICCRALVTSRLISRILQDCAAELRWHLTASLLPGATCSTPPSEFVDEFISSSHQKKLLCNSEFLETEGSLVST